MTSTETTSRPVNQKTFKKYTSLPQPKI